MGRGLLAAGVPRPAFPAARGRAESVGPARSPGAAYWRAMARRLACVALLSLAAVGPAGAALPRAGALVPGRSLGGVRLGEPGTRVLAALGFHGVCRGCARPTWYFTYRAFDDHGLGVELTRGRVSAVYTLWRPDGWHAPNGLRLGAVAAQVTTLAAGTLLPISCGVYEALVRDETAARTAYYVANGKLWGFGLLRRGANPCR
jgi:hypothetical protein